MKYFLFWLKMFSLLLFIPAVAVAQLKEEYKMFSPYKDFITVTPLSKTPQKYFIAKLNKDELSTNKKNNRFAVVRQIDDSIFILKDLHSSQGILPFPHLAANNYWKFSPTLLNEIVSGKNNLHEVFLVTVDDAKRFSQFAIENGVAVSATTAANTFTAKIYSPDQFEQLISCDVVNFISVYNTHPRPEIIINNLDLSTNKINLLHSKFPALSGDGLVVSIKENKLDTADIDFKGRYISNPLASPVIDPHATIMATIAAGAGNSYYLGKGVAYSAGITSSSFDNLLPDPNANYLQYGITVQNHSYGVNIENFYGADAAAYDAAALANDKLLFVFSAGNSGNVTTTTGRYAGISKTANLTGSFKMAKNIVTVGAVDSFNNVVDFSSRGPAYDGRIKPEMVAYGLDGSSGAAALVSGTSILLQQAYKIANGTLPPSSLVKAALINSCDDVASPGIDFKSGFGSLNAFRAAQTIVSQQFFLGAVGNGATQNISLPVPANIKRLKCTLVWNDLPASANAFTALKNDLDLRITTSTSQVFLPYVLNSFPNIDSLNLLPVRKRDSLNTIEQITIDDPAAGTYNISVSGFSVQGATQSFSITYQYDTANTFMWQFPSAADNIFPAKANILRWSTTITNPTASLDYSFNNGISWLPISSNVNVSTGYTTWLAPDTNTTALLRMNIGSAQFISDTFTISAKPELRVGFNCTDSVLLYWNKNKAVTKYQLYGLGAKFLEPITVITDTQFVFKKTNFPYTIFAVAALFGSKPGVKSFALNYNSNSIGCYVNNLTADIVNNKGFLQLSMGTTYLVQRIVFQKLVAGNFIALAEIGNINGINFSATDGNLQTGLNKYRVAIFLTDGRIIYSNIAQLFYQGNKNVIVYPNPVKAGSSITLNFRLLNNQVITLTDVAGRIVYKDIASSTIFSLFARYGQGLYLLKVTDRETSNVEVHKIIIN